MSPPPANGEKGNDTEPATTPVKQDSESSGQTQCVVPTAAVFAAVLERLNRQSTIELFQKLTTEIDAHCQSLLTIADRSRGANSSDLRAELEALLTLLRETTERHNREKEIAAQERKESQGRRLVLILLVILLVGGLAFLVGWLLGKRGAITACPPCPAAVCCNTDVPAKNMNPGAAVMGMGAEESGPVRVPTAAKPVKPLAFEAALSAFLAKPGELPRTFTMDRLRYPANSHEMNAEGKDQVYELSRILAEHPTVHIEIRGHNDSTEDETYTGPNPYQNYSLSKLRANCVLLRLHHLNVSSDRMQLRGMAASMPVASDTTPEGRQANRRVEVVVTHR